MSAIDAQIIQTFRTLGTEEKRLFLSAFEAALAKQASPALSHPSPEDENRQDVSNLDTSLIDVPVLPVVDFPGSKDLAVPASQSPCGVRVDTIFSYCSCFSGICVANFSKYLAKSPSKERYDSV